MSPTQHWPVGIYKDVHITKRQHLNREKRARSTLDGRRRTTISENKNRQANPEASLIFVEFDNMKPEKLLYTVDVLKRRHLRCLRAAKEKKASSKQFAIQRCAGDKKLTTPPSISWYRLLASTPPHLNEMAPLNSVTGPTPAPSSSSSRQTQKPT